MTITNAGGRQRYFRNDTKFVQLNAATYVRSNMKLQSIMVALYFLKEIKNWTGIPEILIKHQLMSKMA